MTLLSQWLLGGLAGPITTRREIVQAVRALFEGLGYICVASVTFVCVVCWIANRFDRSARPEPIAPTEDR